jgi:chemotaxis protein methyltransferase CheR
MLSDEAAASGVEDLEVRLFLEAIYARYGYDLREYAAVTLKRRVLAALARSGAGHLGELQHRVLANPEYFGQIVDDLTVRVSSLFRDPQVYRAVRERVTPFLRTYPLLNIWHGGCATGEEAYSAAILLTEEGLYDRCQIYATDMSATALEQAKQGVYDARHLEAARDNYRQAGGKATLDSYCTTAYERFAVHESLRRKILFFQHSLVSDHVFGEMHIIFCRNVLIYFEPELRERVMKKFAQSLCPGGFLCLGTSESLSTNDRKVFSDFAPNERIYRYQG